MEATQAETQVKETEAGQKKPLPWKLPKKGKKWKRGAVLLLVVVLGVWWFVLRPMGAAGQAVGAGMYRTDTAQVRDLTVSVDGSGTVTPIESYDVRALVTGEILEAPFEVGDQIEKGDLLYRLDAGEAETALQQAQLSLRQAQLSYDELASGMTPSAGTAGVVQEVQVQKGQLVSAGTPIAEIADTSTMTLTLPFQSANAQGLAPGQSAQVTIAGTGEVLSGTVESVASADLVGAGGALVRQVTLRVQNPGALTDAPSATATVGDVACAGSGTFAANARQTVVAQTSGEVTQVHVTAGTRVSAGTALVTLGGETAQNALENASIALETAQLSLQRAQEALDNYTVTAPISGTVIEKNFKQGDKLDGNSTGAMAVLYDLSKLKLAMNVSELNIGQVQPGQQVEITAEALPGETFLGTVDQVSINGTTTNGFTTYPVTILLEEYGSLNPGMNVSAKLIVEQAKGALSIPVEAVNSDGTVLVPGEGALNPDGTVADPAKLERRQVTLGRGDQQYIEITSGLEEGETVLLPAQASGGVSDEESSAVAVTGG